jgi:hypothetical protein
MTKADGMDYDNEVTVETFDEFTGTWTTAMKYEAI